MSDTEDLSGIYEYDRGDQCTIERNSPWSYEIICVSGRHLSTGQRDIQEWIAKGWYTFMKTLEPKPTIDNAFRAQHV